MPPQISRGINIVQFKLSKPAHLPFHLLVWGQYFVKTHNCRPFFNDSVSPQNITTINSATSGGSNRRLGNADNSEDISRYLRAKPQARGHHNSEAQLDAEITAKIDFSLVPDIDLYEICQASSIQASWGGPFNVSYMKKTDEVFMEESYQQKSEAKEGASVFHPLKFVYYTECDQIVRFDDEMTLQALSAASNNTCFFVGRRKEKRVDADPSNYMDGLGNWRECGVPGFSLTWPRDIHVMADT